MKTIRKIKLLSLLSTAALAGGFFTSSMAQTAANVNVTAIVQSMCSFDLNKTKDIRFEYDPQASKDATADGSIHLNCIKRSKPTIALSYGNNNVGDKRIMKDANSGDPLAYQLYQPDSDGDHCFYTTEWTPTNKYTVNHHWWERGAKDKDIKICGKIQHGQDVGAGTYSDVVIASLDT